MVHGLRRVGKKEAQNKEMNENAPADPAGVRAGWQKRFTFFRVLRNLTRRDRTFSLVSLFCETLFLVVVMFGVVIPCLSLSV
jgi:hypothetical protein